MYTEVTALCENEGFCWASNGYFEKLYGADECTVRRWLKELVETSFVTVDLAANQHVQRRVFIVDARTILAGQKCSDKNVRQITTRIENDTRTNNLPKPKGEPDGFEEIWKANWSRGTAPQSTTTGIEGLCGCAQARILAG
jgi:hypothetical protein